MKNFIFFFIFLISSVFSSISVYFTPSAEAEKELLEIIKKSKKSVLIAAYNFNYEKIIKILENKKYEEIKIIAGNKFSSPFLNEKVKIYKGNHLFHSKFIVVDESITIVGSCNFTENDFRLFHNNFIVIKDKKISAFFRQKFYSLWNGQKSNKIFKNEYIEILFSPENSLEGKIIEEIEKAKKSIFFAVFAFNSKNITKSLIKKKIKGVKIKGIFENYNTSRNSSFYTFRDFGIEVKKSNMAGFLHDKLFIIDSQTIITGSYNPTNAAKKNYETLIILKDKKISEKYLKEWEKLWRWKCLR